MAACVLGAFTYFPIFKAITYYDNPALEAVQKNTPIFVTADPATCHFKFKPAGTSKFTSSCDIAKAKLAAASINYKNWR